MGVLVLLMFGIGAFIKQRCVIHVYSGTFRLKLNQMSPSSSVLDLDKSIVFFVFCFCVWGGCPTRSKKLKPSQLSGSMRYVIPLPRIRWQHMGVDQLAYKTL